MPHTVPFVLRMKVSARAFVKVLEGAHGGRHLKLHSPEADLEMKKSSKEKPIGQWGSGHRKEVEQGVSQNCKVCIGGDVGVILAQSYRRSLETV